MSVFNWHVRVYYEDTDTGGIVYYANYLKFFERARTEWLRQTHVGQHTLAAERGIMFVVKSAQVDYHQPAKLDDELRISVQIEKLGRASISFLQQTWRGETCLVSGKIVVACVNRDTLRPCAIPPDVQQKLQIHPVVHPITGSSL